jgi:hypothetical protein
MKHNEEETTKQAIDIALKTWYPKDHELHLNPHHPLGKLLGEWGELLDDYANTLPDSTKKYFAKLLAKWGKLMDNYMKSLYKPGYVFEPEDELGDIWYYVRILAYQGSHILNDIVEYQDCNLDTIIADVMMHTSRALFYESDNRRFLDNSYSAIIQIAKRYNLTLDGLTASNWQKLKPGSKRGEEWMKARER